ncbi:VOC family protein [Actinokineospora enzanensis]|uniref:VOC family protein n=1 Tax=Actinokineospora enzanensis TaxID=155975 RepID=UPI00037F637C|nr:VOC family protein [Actinokineospora enzanensis]
MTTDIPKAGLYPCLLYKDARKAIDWLVEAFGFTRNIQFEGPDGTIAHAELGWHGNSVMVNSIGTGVRLATEVGQGGIYLVVDDPDAHYARAVAAGAEIIRELRDEDFGTSRGYAARDPEGHVWVIGTYQPSHEPTTIPAG